MNSVQTWTSQVLAAGQEAKAICFENQSAADTARQDINALALNIDGVEGKFGEDLFAHLSKYPGEGGKAFYAALTAHGCEALAVIELTLRERNRQALKAGRPKDCISYSISLSWDESISGVQLDDGGRKATMTVFSHRQGNFPFVTGVDKQTHTKYFRIPTVEEYELWVDTNGNSGVIETIWKCQPADRQVSYLEGMRWMKAQHDGQEIQNTYSVKDFLGKIEKRSNASGFANFIRAQIRLLEDELGIERDAYRNTRVAKAGTANLREQLYARGLVGVAVAACDPDGDPEVAEE